MVNYFFVLLIHLIADFYLQSDKLAQCKRAKVNDNCEPCTDCKPSTFFNMKKMLIHVAIYTLPYTSLVILLKWYWVLLFLVVTYIIHFLVDIMTSFLIRKTKHIYTFAIDQIFHISSLFILVYFLPFNNNLNSYFNIIKASSLILFLLHPSAIIINSLFKDLFEDKELSVFDQGTIIGMLERLMVLTLILLDSLTAIAIIITAKTWARSGEMKSNKEFSSKYLVGTLASFLLAIICAIAWKELKQI